MIKKTKCSKGALQEGLILHEIFLSTYFQNSLLMA
jgi:hypothetical protein